MNLEIILTGVGVLVIGLAFVPVINGVVELSGGPGTILFYVTILVALLIVGTASKIIYAGIKSKY